MSIAGGRPGGAVWLAGWLAWAFLHGVGARVCLSLVLCVFLLVGCCSLGVNKGGRGVGSGVGRTGWDGIGLDITTYYNYYSQSVEYINTSTSQYYNPSIWCLIVSL